MMINTHTYKQFVCITLTIMLGISSVSATSSADPLKKSEKNLRWRLIDKVSIKPSNERMTITQQSIKVTGNVLDEDGLPILGANIFDLSTKNGVVTNREGFFSIEVAPHSILRISYIGYLNQEITVNKSEHLTIQLEDDAKSLDEVVVVGFGTQKKVNLTGAVSTVDVNKTLSSRPIADVGRGLQGTTSGLSVVTRNGEIGSDPLIKIRGQVGSVSGKTSPLILLDNVEIPSIQLINPDDIESISILKDAASASIYGAKAAFGVILITSKSGKGKEKVNISYSTNVSWQNAAKSFHMAGIDGLHYTMEAAERTNAVKTGAFYKVSRESIARTEEWLKNYGNLGVNDPTIFGRDWYVSSEGDKMGVRIYNPYDYMIREWTPTQNHTLSISGQVSKTSFNIGLGLLDQSGMFKPAKHDDFKRYNGSISLQTELNKYLTVKGGMIFSKREKRYPASIKALYDPWYYLYRWGPTHALGDTDEGFPLRGAVSEVATANTAHNTDNYTSVNIGATINLAENWTVNIDFTHANNEFKTEYPGTRYTAADLWAAAIADLDENKEQLYKDATGVYVSKDAEGAMRAYRLNNHEYTGKGTGADFIERASSNSKRNTLNAYTTYNKKIGEVHQLKLIAGVNQVTYNMKSHWSKITELLDLANPQFDLANGIQTAGGKSFWDAQLGYYGRVNYAFADRYLLEANLRYDGTSIFTPELRWRWFPSFSVGWRASEEEFLSWMKPTVDQLKFRGSWGTIGDQTVSNDLYLPVMPTNTTPWLSANGKKFVSFLSPAEISKLITWQDITTLDVGFDLRMFKNRLGVTFDWYKRETQNMIIPGSPVPETFGIGAPRGNFGNLRTVGWEITVDFNHRFSNGLGVNLFATLSDAVSDVTKYDNSIKRITNSWYEGKRYGDFWGYTTDRLYQKDDFVYINDVLSKVYVKDGKKIGRVEEINKKDLPAGAKVMHELKDENAVYQDYFQKGKFMFGPGDVKYVDLNGDGQINDGTNTEDNAGDKKILGNSLPRYEYGFRVDADYKGFDFSIFFQGVGRRSIWGAGNLAIPGFNTGDGAMPQEFAGNYWREDRTDAFYPRPWNLAAASQGYNMEVQTKYVLDMSYLRIKNITVGYSLPKNTLRKIGGEKARCYLSLENFFTFDKLRDLPIDPEVVTSYHFFGYNNHNLGRTGMSTPVFKSVSLGLQITF